MWKGHLFKESEKETCIMESYNDESWLENMINTVYTVYDESKAGVKMSGMYYK